MNDALFVVYVLVAVVWALFLLFFLSGRFDLAVLALAGLGTAVANALYAAHRFCEGAMERMRQLGTMV